jgi:hypothetical protein
MILIPVIYRKYPIIVREKSQNKNPSLSIHFLFLKIFLNLQKIMH